MSDRKKRVTVELDKISWKEAASASFSMCDTYITLISRTISLFSVKGIWVPYVPTKVAFFAWEVTWVKP